MCALHRLALMCAFKQADGRCRKTLQWEISTTFVGHVRLSIVNPDERSPQSLSPEAIAQLVGGHREFLAFLMRRVESKEAAEDILQTAFTKGLERGAEVEDEKVVAWFYRVLRNSIIDHYRKRS